MEKCETWSRRVVCVFIHLVRRAVKVLVFGVQWGMGHARSHWRKARLHFVWLLAPSIIHKQLCLLAMFITYNTVSSIYNCVIILVPDQKYYIICTVFNEVSFCAWLLISWYLLDKFLNIICVSIFLSNLVKTVWPKLLSSWHYNRKIKV